MKKKSFDWGTSNKWPILVYVLGLIFSIGFMYAQFQNVLSNQISMKEEMTTFLDLHNQEIHAITVLQTNQRIVFDDLKLPYSEFSIGDSSGQLK